MYDNTLPRMATTITPKRGTAQPVPSPKNPKKAAKKPAETGALVKVPRKRGAAKRRQRRANGGGLVNAVRDVAHVAGPVVLAAAAGFLDGHGGDPRAAGRAAAEALGTWFFDGSGHARCGETMRVLDPGENEGRREIPKPAGCL